jgi:hypothetical protein
MVDVIKRAEKTAAAGALVHQTAFDPELPILAEKTPITG